MKFIYNTEKKFLRRWNPNAYIDGRRLKVIEAASRQEALEQVEPKKASPLPSTFVTPKATYRSVFDIEEDIPDAPVLKAKTTKKRK